MRRPRIAIKLSTRMYEALVNLALRVIAAMTGNLNFLAPAVALTDLQTQATAVQNALAAWIGPSGNHGSKTDLANLRQQALILQQMLTAEPRYVEPTAQILAG